MQEHSMRILTFYDHSGGAWWHRTINIQRHLPPDIQLEILELYTPFDPNAYDFILLFEEYLIEAVWFVPPHKIIAGSSVSGLDHKAVAALQEGRCVAAVFNSLEMLQRHSDISNCFCCQNGVDETLFHPAAHIPDQTIACWVGNAKSKYCNKGLDIIQAACLRAEVPLVFWDASASHTAKSQEWLRDHIYHKATVYICASEHEGTPNPALEALSCGLPVISTAVGNMPEIIQDGYNGYIVSRHTESIVNALKSISHNRGEHLHTNARASILNGWTWRHQAIKYADMFRVLYERRMFFSPTHTTVNPLTFQREAWINITKGKFLQAVFFARWALKYTSLWRTFRKLKHRFRFAYHILK